MWRIIQPYRGSAPMVLVQIVWSPVENSFIQYNFITKVNIKIVSNFSRINEILYKILHHLATNTLKS